VEDGEVVQEEDLSGAVSRFSRFLGGASRGRAGAWCGLTAGEHARSFWLIWASRPIHQSCPRTTVCADVMLGLDIDTDGWS
jgi:hypothetical protein